MANATYAVNFTGALDDAEPPSLSDLCETLESRYADWGFEIAVADITPDDDQPRCPCGNLLIGDDQVSIGRCDFHEEVQ